LEEEEERPEEDYLPHQPSVAVCLGDLAGLTLFTSVSQMHHDECNEAQKTVDSSSVPYGEEIGSKQGDAHKDGGANPFNNVENSGQQNSGIVNFACCVAFKKTSVCQFASIIASSV